MFRKALRLFARGLWLRCPACGAGQLFASWFRMRERCPICGLRFEREHGYYTGAMGVNLVMTELAVVLGTIPLAFDTRVPVLPLVLGAALASVALPCLCYPYSRSLWLAFDLLVNPGQDD
jgi:uncharacterized protein (DUF983 family)